MNPLFRGAALVVLLATGCDGVGTKSVPSASSTALPATAAAPQASCPGLTLRPRDDAEKGPLQEVDWSPDGRRFATGSTVASNAGVFRLWDAVALTVVATKRLASEAAGFGSARPARPTFVARGRALTLETPPSRETWIWHLTDLADHGVVRLKATTAALPSAFVAPDARHAIVMSGWGQQQLFDAATGRAGAAIDPGLGSSSMGATKLWLPDGKTLLTTDATGEVHRWNRQALTRLTLTREPVERRSGVPNLAATRDGRLLAIAFASGTVELWSFPEGRRLHRLRRGVWDAKGDMGPPHGISITPDDRWLFLQLADGSAHQWGLPDGVPHFTLSKPRHAPEDVYQFISGSVELSSDGAYLDTKVEARLDLPGRMLVNLYSMGAPPRQLRTLETGWFGDVYRGFGGWLEEGHHFVEWSEDGKAHVWDPQAHRSIRGLPAGRLDPSETLRAEADGDLRITRLSDGHWLAWRELADGSMIVVDDRGCIDGNVQAGRDQLRLPDGGAPTEAALQAARREALAASFRHR